jgi:ATP-dependent Clp protease adapter protein ClpS
MEMKADITEQKEEMRIEKARHDELKKNLIALPIEGAKKSLIYDSRAFEPDAGYSVFIYNNNVTKLQDVVKVLKETIKVSEQQAIQIAHFVNDKGAAIVKITPNLEEAEEICRAFAAYGIQSEHIKH